MPVISVRRASTADRPAVERLWLMFRHDMSEFGGQLPNPDGMFRAERLAAAFEEQDWAGYVFTGPEDRPVGFAIVRSLAGPVRVLSGRTGERRAVPGRPDLPPDVWISFTAGQTAHSSRPRVLFARRDGEER